jgi:hypothetical protein
MAKTVTGNEIVLADLTLKPALPVSGTTPRK